MGVGPFTTTTGNVSDMFGTEITPSGWTFSIWSVIYVWLTLMIIYILTNLCRKNSYGYVYCCPPVLPYGFFICWCLNMWFNIAWLLVWDRVWMIAALVFLILVVGTNCGMTYFACYGLYVYGAWLNKYHNMDLWLIRILVQNGVMIYTTWTTIAMLINLAIVLTYEANVSPTNAATMSYCALTVVLLVWFFLQNVILDKHMRYIFIDYPVIIWALAGNFDKNYNAESLTLSAIFIVVLLVVASILYAVRLVLLFWRHCNQPFFKGVSPEAMDPMEISQQLKWILR
ncbi:uncharacterized protein si:ch211-161h7.5 [Syngnathoides biaculeatus]|uniref:uncharacterized protein si:ch211-161h7.5 n=1 Tax=Syngnathoides biaculeatus TaxID=300417 RepID=UPI002ADD99BF|nr:uncharacterized protein si:ch211-161h7.5 [Syngnathoides biaculeatus]